MARGKNFFKKASPLQLATMGGSIAAGVTVAQWGAQKAFENAEPATKDGWLPILAKFAAAVVAAPLLSKYDPKLAIGFSGGIAANAALHAASKIKAEQGSGAAPQAGYTDASPGDYINGLAGGDSYVDGFVSMAPA